MAFRILAVVPLFVLSLCATGALAQDWPAALEEARALEDPAARARGVVDAHYYAGDMVSALRLAEQGEEQDLGVYFPYLGTRLALDLDLPLLARGHWTALRDGLEAKRWPMDDTEVDWYQDTVKSLEGELRARERVHAAAQASVRLARAVVLGVLVVLGLLFWLGLRGGFHAPQPTGRS